MRRADQLPRVGLWLSCGGLIVLAAHHWLTVYEAELSIDNLMLLAGGLAGYLATAVGVFLSVAYWSRHRSARQDPAGTSQARAQAAHGKRLASEDLADGHPESPARTESARRMAESFLAWCEQTAPSAHPWSSFDQLVREMLTEQLGAVRVRCYQVLPGDQQLRSLAQLETASEAKCARSGILGHVATVGREFVAADPAQGELVHQLAQDGDEPWDWVCPIREATQTVGLVAVGKLPAPQALDAARRRELSTLLTLFWKYVTRLEQLHIAEQTDKASGLLTRRDFFASATQALADSYLENEPVVVVVLTLEGLRWLDDVGRWSDHDALVENIGLLIKRRMRTDDIIGRFSDDRFVLLLRRLDSSLGRLIAAKIQNTAHEQIAQLPDAAGTLEVRAGLTGSGFRKEPLDKLLVSAFAAVERARTDNVGLYCDLPSPKPDQPAAPPERDTPQVQHEGSRP